MGLGVTTRGLVAGWGRGMVKYRDEVEMGFSGSQAVLGLTG